MPNSATGDQPLTALGVLFRGLGGSGFCPGGLDTGLEPVCQWGMQSTATDRSAANCQVAPNRPMSALAVSKRAQKTRRKHQPHQQCLQWDRRQRLSIRQIHVKCDLPFSLHQIDLDFQYHPIDLLLHLTDSIARQNRRDGLLPLSSSPLPVSPGP